MSIYYELYEETVRFVKFPYYISESNKVLKLANRISVSICAEWILVIY